MVNSIDVTTLQQTLFALEKWTEHWQLTISVDKRAVLQIDKVEECVTLCPGGFALPNMSSYRDLDIIVTSDLTPSEHV